MQMMQKAHLFVRLGLFCEVEIRDNIHLVNSLPCEFSQSLAWCCLQVSKFCVPLRVPTIVRTVRRNTISQRLLLYRDDVCLQYDGMTEIVVEMGSLKVTRK